MAKRRQILVRGGLLAAAVTAGAGLLAASPDPPVRAPQAAARAGPAAAEPVRLELPERRALTPGGRDLFGTPAPPRPVRVVEPEPAPPAQPAPPTAPPLPFTFVGTFEADDGETVYYLGEADKVHAVKRGEAVNGVYRLEAAAAEQLELVYLPLAIKQTLLLGNTK
jgi:hypothetical protein